jgi:hypothetical protein
MTAAAAVATSHLARARITCASSQPVGFGSPAYRKVQSLTGLLVAASAGAAVLRRSTGREIAG